ncbi:MAG: TetR/AcrR family transcriptional regulator [Elusimicrobiota bacterium]|nr:MAG: TetR/AcrR family transcriptional regulator [Elusimicrobiota bacterium]
MKTVVRDPDSKKRLILASARRLLVKRGFQDLVLDDIARDAGVAKGTLFLHYKSKDELFTAVFADLVDGLGLELETLPKTGLAGKDLLLATAKVVLNHFDHNRDFMAQVATGRFPGCGDKSCDKLMDKFKANHARMRAILVLAAKDGGKSADLDFATGAFFVLCRTATMRKLFEKHDRPLEKEAEKIVTFFLEGSGVAL